MKKVGTLFFEMIRIIKEKKARKKQPKVVFFENVKNLVGHDNGNTFQVILEHLEHLGYKVQTQVLNACEYGNVPQNRERIYIVGFLDENSIVRRLAYYREETRLRGEIDKYRTEYEENTRRLNELAVDSGAIEQIAREKHLMKKPNEDIYVFQEDVEE